MRWLKAFGRLTQVEREVAALRAELAEQRREVEARAGAAGEEVAVLRREIEAGKSGLDAERVRFGRLDEDLAHVRERIDGGEERVGAAERRCEEEAAALRGDVAELRLALARVEARLRVAVEEGDRTAAALLDRIEGDRAT